jgi:parallel beta-helix repeat protein
VNETGKRTVKVAGLNGCGELDMANTHYDLLNDITTNGTCFTINASNITLDLNGFNITGDGGSSDYGIYSPGIIVTATSLTLPDDVDEDEFYSGGVSWTDENYITRGYGENEYGYTSNFPTAFDPSDDLYFSDFDFADVVPADATIMGIYVEIKHWGSAPSDIYDYELRLVDKNVDKVGDDYAKDPDDEWAGSLETFTYGGPVDMWGTSLDASDIRDYRFGLDLMIATDDEDEYGRVYTVKMKVYYQYELDNEDLTVMNGNIYNFGRGIYSLDDNATLTNLNVSSNGYGIYINSSSNNTLTNITANSNDCGIALESSSNNTLTDNNIWNCTDAASGCLYLDNTTNSEISRGTINSSSSHLVFIDGGSDSNNLTNLTLINATGHAVLVNDGSTNNRFENLTIQNTTLAAFNITSSNDNSIVNNTFSETPWDYYVYDSTVHVPRRLGLQPVQRHLDNPEQHLRQLEL